MRTGGRAMIDLLLSWFARFDQEIEGQGLVEYGLILLLVSIVSVAALTIMGGQISTMITTVAGAF
jgi:Flp pilus assembly pilin Flp